MDDNFDAGFVKSRRNLILTSTLIFIYLSGAVKLAKNTNFAGIAIELGEIKTVVTWLLIFNVYFFWRYYVEWRKSKFVYQYANSLMSRLEKDHVNYLTNMNQDRLKTVSQNHNNDGTPRVESKAKIYLSFFSKVESNILLVAKTGMSTKMIEKTQPPYLVTLWISTAGNAAEILNEKAFSEALLPLLLGAIAFLCLTYHIFLLSFSCLP